MNFLSLLVISLVFGSSLLFEKSCSNKQNQNTAGKQHPTKMMAATTPSPLNKRQWIPPTYLGLRLGKSIEQDVKRIFGEPVWQGAREEKIFENDAEDEILLDYLGIEGFDNIAVTIGRKTRIVKAIAVYPNEKLTKEDIISKHGTSFFEIESWESMCIKNDRPLGKNGKKMQYPIILVYPHKGMYVFVSDENKMTYFGFLYKCA